MESKMFTAELIVTPRPGVRDPQAEAVTEALQDLYPQRAAGAAKVHCVGRYLRLQLAAADAVAARTQVEQMCRELLVNPNLESFELRISASGEGGA